MNQTPFINYALEIAIRNYIDSKDNKNSVLYNSFLVVIIRSLILIYNEEDIINPYYIRNHVAFVNNLGKYGITDSNIILFLQELQNYYTFDKENEKRKIKLKNPYFINVQKYLVDMFIAKRNRVNINYNDEETFLDLLYTKNTKNAYRMSYNYLMSEDPNYIEKYYYTKLNNFEMTRVDLDKTISNLNLEALNYIGVNLSNLKDMNKSEIKEAKEKAYNYFEVDTNSPNREEDLKKMLEYYKDGGKKLSTGNGYVDILLLMSVIVTSLSVLAIMIFHIM